MKIVPDRAEFLSVARPNLRAPIVGIVDISSIDPFDLYRRVRRDGNGFVLESGKGGRYSYVGVGPCREFTSLGAECRMDGESVHGNPLQVLRKEFDPEAVIENPELHNFVGGAVGYFAYDIARHIERLPALAQNDVPLPESWFLFVDRFYELSHAERLMRIVVAPRLHDGDIGAQYDAAVAELDQMLAASQAPVTDYRSPRTAGDVVLRQANIEPEEFEEMVRRAIEYIIAGDIFQVNLSVRFQRSFPLDPLRLYGCLRSINPSPYMSYFDLDGAAIVSASPELLLKLRDGIIETRPIAGTRPRGANPEEDTANARDLIDNEKERAEHLMLVDLERNDIGRVARYGTVIVDEFMGIEEYSHVIHIVSHVRGELREGLDMFDAIVACFPGGTITGAPKVRAMEIIDELEPCRRGIYTGSIGWLGNNGDAELNIAIRTIVVTDGVAYMQAGAGIVADSIPEFEYRESMRKAEAGLLAIERSLAEALQEDTSP